MKTIGTWENSDDQARSGQRDIDTVIISEILARNYVKTMQESGRGKSRTPWPEITWKRCKSPAVEIAEILARNYVKTIQLDLESSGERFMYLLGNFELLW